MGISFLLGGGREVREMEASKVVILFVYLCICICVFVFACVTHANIFFADWGEGGSGN